MKKQLTQMKNRYRNSSYGICAAIATALVFTVVFSGCKKTNLNQKGAGYAASQSGRSLTGTGPDFTIAVIPDPQYATGDIDVEGVKYHGKDQMFKDEVNYILANKTAQNIVYVAGVGDLTDCGDDSINYHYLHTQWTNASSNGGMYRLDTAGIPYGLAIGNHEELPSQLPLTSRTTYFNRYFGVSHFTGKSYYGGAYSVYHSDSPTNPNDNANHFDLFTAGGLDWIVIYVEYDNGLTLKTHPSATDNVYTWASNLLTTYASRKAIVVTHFVGNGQKGAWNDTTGVKTPTQFSGQGDYMYGQLKQHSNLFMLLGGHINGEGYRQDTYNGQTKKSLISDYQFYKDKDGRNNGGDGYLRLVKISTINDLISVRTLSPYLIAGHDSLPTNPNRLKPEMTDQYSKFTRALFHEQTTTRTCDFNNDGKSELSFYDPPTGNWTINGVGITNYGLIADNDVPVPGDYNGDGQTDYAIFRPGATTNTGAFHIKNQSVITWGSIGDIPVPGDYDNDGKADVAVWRPSNNTWYIKRSGDGTDTTRVYGASSDHMIPTPGDYDGDGKVDASFWDPTTYHWYIQGQTGWDYGGPGNIPVPGDYNGDGLTDGALFAPSTGKWYLHNITEITFSPYTITAEDIPVPGDYFGDGKTHPAIYRPSTHTLYTWNGTAWGTTVLGSGPAGKPINLPYCIRQAFTALH